MGLTIGQAARAAEVNVETIRFYERQGLIEQPATPPHGFRRYDDDVIRRIRSIKRAQNLGFTLAEIQGLLSLSAGDCDDVRARAEAKLEEVEAKIRDLKRVKNALHGVIASCRSRAAREPCPILEALGHERPLPAARQTHPHHTNGRRK